MIVKYFIETIDDLKTDNRILKPFTQRELVERAKLADKDYKEGKFIAQELLELESESW